MLILHVPYTDHTQLENKQTKHINLISATIANKFQVCWCLKPQTKQNFQKFINPMGSILLLEFTVYQYLSHPW